MKSTPPFPSGITRSSVQHGKAKCQPYEVALPSSMLGETGQGLKLL